MPRSPERALRIPHAVVDLLLVVVLCAGMALAALAFHRSSVLLGVLLCAATGLLVSPISWQHHYVWCVPLLVWLVSGVDRPRRGVVWAALAAIVFMVMPPGQSGDLNVMWYVRENAYVLAYRRIHGARGRDVVDEEPNPWVAGQQAPHPLRHEPGEHDRKGERVSALVACDIAGKYNLSGVLEPQ